MRSAASFRASPSANPAGMTKKEVPMDLDRHVVRPMTEETGVRAAFGMLVGALVGMAIALPLLVRIFGI